MAVVPGASVCISSSHKSISVNIFQIKNVSLKCFTTSCFQKRLTKSCPSVKILCFSLSLNCVFLYCPVYSVQVCIGCFLRLLTVQFWLRASQYRKVLKRETGFVSVTFFFVFISLRWIYDQPVFHSYLFFYYSCIAYFIVFFLWKKNQFHQNQYHFTCTYRSIELIFIDHG